MAGKVMRLDLLNSKSYVVVFLFAIIFTEWWGVFFQQKKDFFHSILDP